MKKQLIIASFFATGFLKISAQTFCFTPAYSSNIDLFASSFKSAAVQEYYELRIYVHVIRRSNGTGGQAVSDVNTALDF